MLRRHWSLKGNYMYSSTAVTNVIYKSADFKNCAPSFKNTIVINITNYYIVYNVTASNSIGKPIGL